MHFEKRPNGCRNCVLFPDTAVLGGEMWLANIRAVQLHDCNSIEMIASNKALCHARALCCDGGTGTAAVRQHPVYVSPIVDAYETSVDAF